MITRDRLEEWVTGSVLDLSRALTTDRVSQRFCREVVAWRALRHPSVLPLLGVTMTEDLLVMVSEWTVRGNIMEFIKADVKADRLGLVRFSPKVYLCRSLMVTRLS